ncbi:hypothetical protein [Uliginosibacterium aquaticum]|uniref:Restriction system protein Mrr-like N-terminal domain-containing protein n=1 Tax=Uliginosibacterium aquaticum TaxID=2731212 RepID=A0ABX2IJE6_9RHOO|nr:hypothetical protein [Uliginosibacterium aquaticum]NSL56612.1 hypothetical protein [Uliginosibacterium aquaticum]
MHPIFDADALLLLALVPASKRRPATLEEIVIALASVRPELPGAARLRDAFARLSAHGLLLAQDGGYTLSTGAQALLAKVSKKGDAGERVFSLKQALTDFDSPADQPKIELSAAEVGEAVKVWQASLPPPTKSEKFTARTGIKKGPAAARSGSFKPPRKRDFE